MVIDSKIDVWAALFPDSLVPDVIKLVLDSWKIFRTTQTEEVKITQELHAALNRNQKFSKLPFIIDPETILYSETGTEQTGRLDIRIIHGYDREVYFSFECKRLRVQFPSRFDTLAGKYITEGMCRYFNRQYAMDLDKGGMLGYVMDGDINNAINDVQKAIENKHSDLYMQNDESLKISFCISSNQIKETNHKYGPNNKFTIYHIFLPMNVVSNSN